MSVPTGPQDPYYSGAPQSPGQGYYGAPATPTYGTGGQSYGTPGQYGANPYGQAPSAYGDQFQQGTPYQAGGSDFAQTPKPNRPWLVPVIAIATFLAGLGIGVFAGGDPPVPDPTPVPPVTVTATTQPPPVKVTVTVTQGGGSTQDQGNSKAVTSFGDGIWQIGTQIQPGTYRARVPAGSGCYVAFLRTNDETDIIDSDEADPGAAVSVTVPDRDGFVQSKGCGTWTLK